MDMAAAKARVQDVFQARKVVGSSSAFALTLALYRDALAAIADGTAKMPAHLAREVLKAERE